MHGARVNTNGATHANNGFNRPFAGIGGAMKFQTWGQALAHCRIDRGLSHRDVADRCGVNKEAVRDWEMGLSVPTRPQLKRMQNLCFRQIRYFTYLLPAELRKPPEVKPADPDEAFVPEQEEGPPPPELAKPRKEPKTFPEALRRAREEEGLSHGDIAEILDVVAAAVQHWESDRTRPYVHNYEKLLQLFPSIGNVPRPKDMRVLRAAAKQPAPTPPPARVAPPAPPAPPATAAAAPPPPAVQAKPQPRNALEDAGAAYGRAVAEAKRARAAVTAAEATMKSLQGAAVEAEEEVKRAHARLLETAS